MGTPSVSESSVHFENFELDLCTGELYRNGEKLRIRGHPVEVLSILLEHPGELVTRETFHKRLWPGNTFVDFEQILNNSIAKLRDALGDRAEKPHFIETLPRLGYRFIAPVQNQKPPSPVVQFPRLALSLPQAQASDEERTPGQRFTLLKPTAIAIALFLAVAAVAYLAFRWQLPTASKIHRIAVLPLVNTSVDPKEDYFADGMTDRLITELSQFNSWEVISRTSVMHYKGSTEALPQIANELSADRIIEGTVQRSGSRVRITAQLIDAERDAHIWSGAFERDMTDVLALQAEIASAIAERTSITLTSQERARLQSPHKVVPAAYDAFLTGKYLFELSKFKEAAEYFEKATTADPNFALAFSYFAEAEGMLYSNLETPRMENPRVEIARRAAQRAMQLDPNLAEAHINAGDWKFFASWDWSAGEAEFRKAYEMDPHSENAEWHYALCLDALRRWDESIAVFKQAIRVDPFSRLLQLGLLSALVHAHRYDEAGVQFKEILKIAPESPNPYWTIGAMYEDMRREKESAAAYLKAGELAGFTSAQTKALQQAFEIGGLRGYWRKRLEMREKELNGKRIPPYSFAVLCAHAGETDKAIEFLEQAYRERQPMMGWINSVTTFDRIKDDPRYQDLLRRMNFPPSAQ